MKTNESGSGVKAAKQAKVVEEMLSIINTPGKFSEKKKLLWKVETKGRPGKDLAERIRHDYFRKFDWYTSRNILGRVPRGIENYGHKIKNEYGHLVLTESMRWEHRFVRYLKSLNNCLDFSLQPRLFFGYDFAGKRNQANQIRAEHLAKIQALKPESERIIAAREEAERKQKATVFSGELTAYLEANFPYRIATSKWAGGETDIGASYRTGYESEAKGWSYRVWSENGKWSGLDAQYRFYINSDEKCMVIGGLVTCYPKRYENKPVKPCVWWEQSLGFELVKKTGFLVGGYHSEAKTRGAAIRGAKASKRYYLKKDEQVLTPEFVHKKFGFCMAGIRNFMAQNNITANRMTVAELRKTVVNNREMNYRNYRVHLSKMGITLNSN